MNKLGKILLITWVMCVTALVVGNTLLIDILSDTQNSIATVLQHQAALLVQLVGQTRVFQW